jgi:hypothetical protein
MNMRQKFSKLQIQDALRTIGPNLVIPMPSVHSEEKVFLS